MRFKRGRHFGIGPGIGLIWIIMALTFGFAGSSPGIFVLLFLLMIFGSFFTGLGRTMFHPPRKHYRRPKPFPPLQWEAPKPVRPARSIPVSKPTPRRDTSWLPATCPHCGAPTTADVVTWRGLKQADCAYCDSNLRGLSG